MSRITSLVATMHSRLAPIQQARLPRVLPVALGAMDFDARLGGGLTRAALHELFAAEPADVSALAGFAVLLAVRAQSDCKPIIWVREDRGDQNNGRLYGHGLVELGANPDYFTIVHAPNTLSALQAGDDMVKCGAVGAVIIEPWGKAPQLDLTASRRLSIAAARSGVMTLLLRSGVDPHPSAALTRWRIAGAPSTALAIEPDSWAKNKPKANVLGLPAFDIEMLRHRSGLPNFTARLEWDRDQSRFVSAPLSGDLPVATALGADPDVRLRAA